MSGGRDASGRRPLVILGSGVIGLTIAHLMAHDTEIASAFDIIVKARDMVDGDLNSQAWASPWAGANWSPMPMGGTDQRIKRWETTTFNKLWDMIPTGLVKMLPTKQFSHEDEDYSNVWWKDLVRDFRVLPAPEIPSPYKSGVAFTTISVDPNSYLPWLRHDLESHGVQFERFVCGSLEELAGSADKPSIVINASSLGSRSLIGVQDETLVPIRGQTILVETPHLQECLLLEEGEDLLKAGQATYIIPRPGGNSALLGGTFQIGNWDTSLDMQIARAIFERCASLAPCLRDPETKIVKHQVGLRPGRIGGPRVELEWLSVPMEGQLVPHIYMVKPHKMLVIHAYGFGPAGYQESWGAAEEVHSLLKENISNKR